MNLINDVYYSREYVELYLGSEDSIFEFYFEDGSFYLYNIAIKRPITKIGNKVINPEYFDLETAYGYGGYLTNSSDKKFIEKAFQIYAQRCVEEKIIAEFVRFHPFNLFPKHYSDQLDFFTHDRDTVTTLKNDYAKVYSQYKSSLKRNIRKANQNSLTFHHEFENKQKYIDIFYDLYTKTMIKNHASQFYFFNKKYFFNLLSSESSLLFLIFHQGKVINAVIAFEGEEYLYYHLGATDPSFYFLNSNSKIFDEIIRIACEKGKALYLGGGTRSDKSDKLFCFKKKFSPNTTPYYIGGKIFNPDVYSSYLKEVERQVTDTKKNFLRYRNM